MFIRFLRWTLALTLAAFLAFNAYFYVTGLQTENSGPHAYFKALPGEDPVIEKGMKFLRAQVADEKNGEAALQLLKSIGFHCDKTNREERMKDGHSASRVDYLEKNFVAQSAMALLAGTDLALIGICGWFRSKSAVLGLYSIPQF